MCEPRLISPSTRLALVGLSLASAMMDRWILKSRSVAGPGGHTEQPVPKLSRLSPTPDAVRPGAEGEGRGRGGRREGFADDHSAPSVGYPGHAACGTTQDGAVPRAEWSSVHAHRKDRRLRLSALVPFLVQATVAAATDAGHRAVRDDRAAHRDPHDSAVAAMLRHATSTSTCCRRSVGHPCAPALSSMLDNVLTTALFLLLVVVTQRYLPRRTGRRHDLYLGLVAVLRFTVLAILWWIERIVITDKRVMLAQGFIVHKIAMMPLTKVTDLTFERSLRGASRLWHVDRRVGRPDPGAQPHRLRTEAGGGLRGPVRARVRREGQDPRHRFARASALGGADRLGPQRHSIPVKAQASPCCGSPPSLAASPPLRRRRSSVQRASSQGKHSSPDPLLCRGCRSSDWPVPVPRYSTTPRSAPDRPGGALRSPRLGDDSAANAIHHAVQHRPIRPRPHQETPPPMATDAGPEEHSGAPPHVRGVRCAGKQLRDATALDRKTDAAP